MHPPSIGLLTICGLEELPGHGSRRVTHVLSILDPEWPDPDAFGAYDPHHRTVLRFHDVLEPGPGLVVPQPDHVEAILAFGRDLAGEGAEDREGHLLVHCHMGISRSTAAMAMLLAQSHPDESEERIFERLLEVRRQAWPNSRMIAFADEQLGRGGRLTAALGGLYGRQLQTFPRFDREMRHLGRAREVEMAR